MASMTKKARKSYVVVTTSYPSSYGCHRGKQWTQAEALCSGYYHLDASDEYPTKKAAIKAAILELDEHVHFEDHDLPQKVPPFDSGSLGNWDNDDEVLIQVMTRCEFDEKVQDNQNCLVYARKEADMIEHLRQAHIQNVLSQSGRSFVHYHYPKRTTDVDIPAEMEIIEPKPVKKTSTNTSTSTSTTTTSTSTSTTTTSTTSSATSNEQEDSIYSNIPSEKLASVRSIHYKMCVRNIAVYEPGRDPFLILLSQTLVLEELHIDGWNNHSYDAPGEYVERLLELAPHLSKTLKVLSFQSGVLMPDTIEALGGFTNLQRLDIADRFDMELGLDLDTRGMQSGDSPPPGGWPAHPYDVELLNCVQQLPKLQRLDLGWGGQFDYNDINCLFDYCLSSQRYNEICRIMAEQGCIVTVSDQREPHKHR